MKIYCIIKMWVSCVILLIMIQASYQEDSCSQQIIDKLSALLDDKLSALLDDKLALVEAKQDKHNEAIMEKFSVIEQKLSDYKLSEVGTKMGEMEDTLTSVVNELSSIKLMTENIGMENNADNDKSVKVETLQQDILSDLEAMKKDVSDDFNDLKIRVEHISETLNNTSELLQKSVCVPNCINGECTAPNTCTCAPGWIGDQCDKAVCNQICLNGKCTTPNNCTCNTGWAGDQCSIALCDRSCINGECTAPNQCSCIPGWNGDQCDTAVCENDCFMGRCTGPNTCSCDPGWNGDHCNKAICDRGCFNGECTALNACTCIPGWTGDQCDKAICKNSCINGECTAPNKCTCNAGWYDVKCDKAVCQPRCISGKCTAPNTCICDLGWTGVQCGCHEAKGFFMSPESNQCFKIFQGKRRTWTGADSMCKSKGLELAKPYNAVGLQIYLNERYGSSQYWVGGRGAGSVFKWLRDGQELPTSSQLWYPGQPDDGFSSNSCIFIYATDTALMSDPGKPYRDSVCSARIYPLCENIMGKSPKAVWIPLGV